MPPKIAPPPASRVAGGGAEGADEAGEAEADDAEADDADVGDGEDDFQIPRTRRSRIALLRVDCVKKPQALLECGFFE